METIVAPPAVLPTTGMLLVATDGSRDADGAVRVGRALARRDEVPLQLLSVVEPLTVYSPDGIPLPDGARELVGIAHEARCATLLDQRDRTHPGTAHWPFLVETGHRVDTIVGTARRMDASLILLGLGAHGIGARLSARETSLRVIREASTPVLAVPSDGWGVPHSALVAVDFTPSSERAARIALHLLGAEGTLYLAHVTPRVPIPQGDPRTWEEISQNGVLPRLEALIHRLDPPRGVRVECVLLHGDPAHELVEFAGQQRIDLVAAGTHGRSSLSRLVMGSVSTSLVRSARCWVLVSPP